MFRLGGSINYLQVERSWVKSHWCLKKKKKFDLSSTVITFVAWVMWPESNPLMALVNIWRTALKLKVIMILYISWNYNTCNTGETSLTHYKVPVILSLDSCSEAAQKYPEGPYGKNITSLFKMFNNKHGNKHGIRTMHV